MSIHQIERFADNWSYLRTELSWLDHVLMAAVARQRKQTKEVDRIAQNKADRVSSHWWQGIVSLEGKAAYDDCRKPPVSASTPKLGYQQQLELRVQASQSTGVLLALPLLRDRLNLTVFEKNLSLLCLAPEINRRYARIYRYLKGDDEIMPNDLPTIDLVLRLLCRNDTEWSQARRSFTSEAVLVRRGLLEIPTRSHDTRLNAVVRLADPLVDFLLSDRPTAADLDEVLDAIHPIMESDGSPFVAAGSFSSAGIPLSGFESFIPESYLTQQATVTWSDLVLPPSLLAALKPIADRLQVQPQVAQQWQDTAGAEALKLGQVMALTGAAGTGKMSVVQAIAHQQPTAVAWLDLAQVNPDRAASVLQDMATQAPSVLMLKSAHLWFGRLAPVSRAELHRFLALRRQQPSLTVLVTQRPDAITPYWRRQIDQQIAIPMPTASDRLLLWQRAFPPSIPLGDLPWQWLADQFPISGGHIRAIAHEASLCAALDPSSPLHIGHLLQALINDHQSLTLESIDQARYTCSGR
ncbi:MAG: hypothetical protein EA367_07655 [Leptolyngbya sp. DLM2.Bin15]|nr:MAG: hypothetical protein EA367_07655 [Leptolyngbya sp. DLM2.Bin15]